MPRLLIATVLSLLYISSLAATSLENIPQAVFANDRQPLSGLLQKNTNPNETYGGVTGLHIAAEYGYAEMADMLLRSGAKSDLVDSSRATPLYWAATNDHPEVARMLLASGCDPNWRDSAGNTPLSAAATSRDVELVRLLVSAKARVSKQDAVALRQAVESDSLAIVQLLIEAGANVCAREANNIQAVELAAEKESTEILRALAERINDCPELLDEALARAASYGRTENLKYLLPLVEDERRVRNKKDSDDSVSSKEPVADALQAAVDHDHPESAKFLAEHSRTLSSSHLGRVLVSTMQHKQQELFDLLVAHGAAFHLARDQGKSVLLQACEDGDFEKVKLAFAHHLSAAELYDDRTPLLAACQSGNPQIVEILLRNRAPIKVRDRDKDGPLLIAARNAKADVCRLLIGAGCDVNGANEDTGSTALHYAAEQNDIVLARILLALGAKTSLRDKRGKTAADIAEEIGATEVFDLLAKADTKQVHHP